MKDGAFSIWVMPRNQLFLRLSMLIRDLSRIYGGPVFEPHVTIIGDLRGNKSDIIDKTYEFAKRLQAYRLTFLGPDHFEEFHKCIFIRVKNSDRVLRSNLIARRIFNRAADSPYDPHLSLVYGTLAPTVKKDIVAELKETSFGSFIATSIYLVSTSGSCDEWYFVGEYPIKS